MQTSKIPHDPSRTIGQWAVGMNHRIGKITAIVGDRYEGVTLDNDVWWTRMPSVFDARDQAILEEAYETRRRLGG